MLRAFLVGPEKNKLLKKFNFYFLIVKSIFKIIFYVYVLNIT